MAVLSDLTEKNRAARDRLQKEKLEGVLEIAGAVCHEFNQPMQVISGYCELLMKELPETPEAVQALKQDILGYELYRGTLVAADGSAACTTTRPPLGPRPVRPVTCARSWKVRSAAR